MSQIQKLEEKLNRKPPPSHIRYEEIDKILKYYKFECRQPSGGSSHYIYTHPKLEQFQLSIARKNPLKVIYVKKAIEAINKLKEFEEGENDE